MKRLWNDALDAAWVVAYRIRNRKATQPETTNSQPSVLSRLAEMQRYL